MPRRRRAEDDALWGRVAATVRPLNPPRNGEGDRAKRGGGPSFSDLLSRTTIQAASSPSTASRLPSPFRGGASSANTLDASWDKRIAKGALIPDFTIDLHGETLSSAHAKLNRSLSAAIRQQVRVILLITGKPAQENPRLPPTSRGVIRASVQDWLAASPHSGQITAIRGAHPRHGGAGALYLVLKRAR